MRRRLDVVSDFHGEDHDAPSVALLCAHLREKQPDVFVFNGDIVDFGSTSKYGPVGRLGAATILEESNTTLTKIIIPVLEAIGFKVEWKMELVDPGNPALKD